MIHIRLIGSGSDTQRLVHEEAEFIFIFIRVHPVWPSTQHSRRRNSSSTCPQRYWLALPLHPSSPFSCCWFSFTPTSASSAPAAWGWPLPALLKHLENSHDMRELIWRWVPLSTLPAQLTFCSKGWQVRSVHRRPKCWWRRGSWRWRDLEIRAAACQENAGGELRDVTPENGDVVFGCAVTCWALPSVSLAVAVPLIFCSRRTQKKRALR